MDKLPIFETVIIATMSAGKSTLTNALVGQELLHSANEATTATITKIYNKDNWVDFIGCAYDYKDNPIKKQVINAQILREWNANPDIKTIDLTGNIQALHNDKAELVIYDTPGPNNSQDDNHEALTMEVINDSNYGLILYVLNATQLGVNDDRSLLEKIKVTLDKDSHKEIIFLLNKADCLDPEKGETLDKIVANAEQHLTNAGFNKPSIIPTSAHYALVIQKALNGISLTRSERNHLKNALSTLNNQFIIHSKIPNELKLQVFNKLNQSKITGKFKLSNGEVIKKEHLQKALTRTGFSALQQLLQQKLTNTKF